MFFAGFPEPWRTCLVADRVDVERRLAVFDSPVAVGGPRLKRVIRVVHRRAEVVWRDLGPPIWSGAGGDQRSGCLRARPIRRPARATAVGRSAGSTKRAAMRRCLRVAMAHTEAKPMNAA